MKKYFIMIGSHNFMFETRQGISELVQWYKEQIDSGKCFNVVIKPGVDVIIRPESLSTVTIMTELEFLNWQREQRFLANQPKLVTQ